MRQGDTHIHSADIINHLSLFIAHLRIASVESSPLQISCLSFEILFIFFSALNDYALFFLVNGGEWPPHYEREKGS